MADTDSLSPGQLDKVMEFQVSLMINNIYKMFDVYICFFMNVYLPCLYYIMLTYYRLIIIEVIIIVN